MISSDADDGDAAADSPFMFGEHMVFDSEEDRLAAMDDYEFTNRGDYMPNPPEDDHLFDDCASSTFPPKILEYHPVDISTQPGISVDKARSNIFK